MKSNRGEMPAAISAGKVCHPGLKRTENQDHGAQGSSPFGEIYVISDGVGGYYGGAEAAQIVADGMVRHMNQMPAVLLPADALSEAARRANAEVFEASQRGEASRRQMSATLVAALLVSQGTAYDAVIVNVGDSRAYLVRGGRLIQLSTDHTAVQRLVEGGVLTREQAKDHPHANVLTRSMGQSPDVSISLKRVSLQNGDRLLLCSDGLHGYVDAEAIRATVDQVPNPHEAVRRLLDLVLAAGAPDNVSMQLLQIDLSTPAGSNGFHWTGRPLIWASCASAAIMLCCAASIGLYRYRQSQPLEMESAPAPADQLFSSPQQLERNNTNTPATPGGASLPLTTNKKTSGVRAEGTLQIGWIASSGEKDREHLSMLETRFQHMTEITESRKAACIVFESAKPTAYYANLDVRKQPEIEGSGVSEWFAAGQTTERIKMACGAYDVILLPAKGSDATREKVATGAAKALKRLRKMGSRAASTN